MTLLRAAEAAVATVVVEDITAQACAAARCMRDAATPAEVTPDVPARPILSPAAQAMASQAVLATPGAIHIADMVRRPRSELRPLEPQPTAVTTTATTRTAIGSATANIRISAEASYLGGGSEEPTAASHLTCRCLGCANICQAVLPTLAY
jgi:hypothetical protein